MGSFADNDRHREPHGVAGGAVHALPSRMASSSSEHFGAARGGGFPTAASYWSRPPQILEGKQWAIALLDDSYVPQLMQPGGWRRGAWVAALRSIYKSSLHIHLGIASPVIATHFQPRRLEESEPV